MAKIRKITAILLPLIPSKESSISPAMVPLALQGKKFPDFTLAFGPEGQGHAFVNLGIKIDYRQRDRFERKEFWRAAWIDKGIPFSDFFTRHLERAVGSLCLHTIVEILKYEQELPNAFAVLVTPLFGRAIKAALIPEGSTSSDWSKPRLVDLQIVGKKELRYLDSRAL